MEKINLFVPGLQEIFAADKERSALGTRAQKLAQGSFCIYHTGEEYVWQREHFEVLPRDGGNAPSWYSREVKTRYDFAEVDLVVAGATDEEYVELWGKLRRGSINLSSRASSCAAWAAKSGAGRTPFWSRNCKAACNTHVRSWAKRTAPRVLLSRMAFRSLSKCPTHFCLSQSAKA